MTMTITMREGDDFFINDTRVKLTGMLSALSFSLTVYWADSEMAVSPSTGKWSPLPLGVHVQIGDSQSPNSKIAKLRIDAPQGVRVLRGVKYRMLQETK